MGFFAARKGNWGAGADLMWTALGTSIEQPPANIDFDQGAFAFYGLRRVSPAAEIIVGLRVNVLQGTIGFKGPLQLTVEPNKTWVDPIVGLNLGSAMNRRVFARLYAEVGGFGAGSDFAWQIFPRIGIHLGERVSLDLGYRWLDTDYESVEGDARFAYNTLLQGPILGSMFRF